MIFTDKTSVLEKINCFLDSRSPITIYRPWRRKIGTLLLLVFESSFLLWLCESVRSFMVIWICRFLTLFPHLVKTNDYHLLHIYSTNISHALLQSCCYNLYAYSRSICWATITQMFSLNSNKKLKYDKFCIQTTKHNLAPHNKTWSVRTFFVPSVPFFP